MDHYKRFLLWDDRRRWAEQKARIMAAPRVEEGACARAERLHKEATRERRAVSTSMHGEALVQPYNHGRDCRMMVTLEEYDRDWRGSAAVIVRKGRGDEPRHLMHRCGKTGPKCRIAAVFNRIPNSSVSKDDTTDMVAKCGSRMGRPLMDIRRGYVVGALRDCQTPYHLGKPRYEQPQGMTEAQ